MDTFVNNGQHEVQVGELHLPGLVSMPANAQGLVLFAHGSGSSRLSTRNQFVARKLQAGGMATLLFDLLTPAEAEDRRNVFDIELLAERVLEAVDWASSNEQLNKLEFGLFGASTGAAAALVAASRPLPTVRAVVSRGGRPDLAYQVLSQVTAPTLLIVGERDEEVLRLNQRALQALTCEKQLQIVPRATHLFTEPGALEEVARLAANWFTAHLGKAREHV